MLSVEEKSEIYARLEVYPEKTPRQVIKEWLQDNRIKRDIPRMVKSLRFDSRVQSAGVSRRVREGVGALLAIKGIGDADLDKIEGALQDALKAVYIMRAGGGEMPLLIQQAKDKAEAEYAEAVARAGGGHAAAAPEEKVRRVAICQDCPLDQFIAETRRCGVSTCACTVDESAGWEAEICPFGFWRNGYQP